MSAGPGAVTDVTTDNSLIFIDRCKKSQRRRGKGRVKISAGFSVSAILSKAFLQLKEAVALARQRPFSKLEEQELIQAFEFTNELAWNTLKDFLGSRGVGNFYGSKDAAREAPLSQA
ncbi:MAG: nucleotidyltransferase substrate binding protein [Desulfobacteraceae bacterium]|nr:nucleotidyltransferase substrate binding protein [Desulfobacteraceae bacterium]